MIFLTAIIAVTVYATLISDKVGFSEKEQIVLTQDNAIIVFMLTAATIISFFCKIDVSDVLNASTFKSGMSACVCILGVAWLGATFVSAHETAIKAFADSVLEANPWLLAVALFFASMLLYSQAATARALMPLAISLTATPVTLVASFAAVSALFVLPTYPTLLVAVEKDDTGSTRIGKYVFDHPWSSHNRVICLFWIYLGGIVL